MKSKVNDCGTPTISYPYLGRTTWSDGKVAIVLFYSKQSGVVIHSTHSSFEAGTHKTVWAESEFTPFIGTIELSNN